MTDTHRPRYLHILVKLAIAVLAAVVALNHPDFAAARPIAPAERPVGAVVDHAGADRDHCLPDPWQGSFTALGSGDAGGRPGSRPAICRATADEEWQHATAAGGHGNALTVRG